MRFKHMALQPDVALFCKRTIIRLKWQQKAINMKYLYLIIFRPLGIVQLLP